jgi:hypothetical protein
MRIEILYVSGCPNYPPAFERLRAIVASEAVQDEIHCVPVSTEAQAKDLLFPGSPTIRVNGKDVEAGKAAAPGLACRLYTNRSGVPSEEVLRRAVSEAKCKE